MIGRFTNECIIGCDLIFKISQNQKFVSSSEFDSHKKIKFIPKISRCRGGASDLKVNFQVTKYDLK